MSFSPDGSVLVSGSYDRTIRLWDVATGEQLKTLQGHTYSITSVAVSPSSTTIASGSIDGTVLLWTFPDITAAIEILGDLNSDGIVNVLDIVLIAASIGESGESDADLDGDGEVNTQDLIIAANALGNAAGAPSVHSLSATQVEQWLSLAKREASQSIQISASDTVSYQRGIQVLEQILESLTPQRQHCLPTIQTRSIRRHDTLPVSISFRGHLDNLCIQRSSRPNLDVRTSTGGYISESQPCSVLDGRNELGEPVASGIYFYTLSTESTRDSVTAGDFTATRKMLIRK